MAENKHKFLLRTDLLKVVELLITKDRTNGTNTTGEFFYHILQYVNDRNHEAVNDTIELIFEPVKADLKSDLKKWEAYREKQAQNGAKGGATKWMNAKKKAGGLQANGGGRVKKIGMKDIQRDGWEYELTVSLTIDRDTHKATASKDRTNLFDNKDPFVITEQTGELIKQWCESGVTAQSVLDSMVKDAVGKLAKCNSIEEMTMLKETLDATVINSAEFKKAGKERYAALQPKPQTEPVTN